MVLEGRTKLINQGGKLVVYIPKSIASDSMFPFKTTDEMYLYVNPEEQSAILTLRKNLPDYKIEKELPKSE